MATPNKLRLAPYAVLALVASCASFEDDLRPECDIPELRPLALLTDALPKRIVRVRSDANADRPIELVIEEMGTGTRRRVLVLIHGVLSDRRVWRYIAGVLGGECDLLLVDLPGCGDSDRPLAGTLGPNAYSPGWLAKHVFAALRVFLGQRANDVQLTLIGHSLGGSVIFRMLGDQALRKEYEDVVSRVDGTVLLAPFDFALARPDPTLVEIARLTELEVWIGKALGILRRKVARSVYMGCVDPTTMPREVMKRIVEIMSDPERLHAAQWMIRRASWFDSNAHLIWSKVAPLVADYQNIDVPCLILWGGLDETLPCSSGYELCTKLPNARLRVLRKAKHSLPSEEPWFCIEWIRRFLAEGNESWAQVAEFDHSSERTFWRGGDLQHQLVAAASPSPLLALGRTGH